MSHLSILLSSSWCETDRAPVGDILAPIRAVFVVDVKGESLCQIGTTNGPITFFVFDDAFRLFYFASRALTYAFQHFELPIQF
jgi:hypothetical protein